MRQASWIAIGLLMTLGQASSTDACSCMFEPIDKSFQTASAVFRGELVSATPHPTDPCGDETLLFKVSRVWKGPSGAFLSVANGSVGRHRDGSLPPGDEKVCIKMCGGVFIEQGKEYVVLAFGKDLHVEYCVAPVRVPSDEGSDLARDLDRLKRWSKN